MNREESLKNWESLKAFDADFARIVGEAGKEFDCPTVAVIYGKRKAEPKTPKYVPPFA